MEISVGARKPKKNPKVNAGVEKYINGNEKVTERIKGIFEKKKELVKLR